MGIGGREDKGKQERDRRKGAFFGPRCSPGECAWQEKGEE
jgi:hypothetical protein